MNSETFGELVKRIRVAKGLALREVAAGVEIDQSLLSKIERNKFVAPQRIIYPLAQLLEVGYRDLQIKYLSEKLYQGLNEVDYSLESLKVVTKRLEKEGSCTTYELERRKLIKNIQEYLKNRPIERAWLFGSFARGEESFDSDIDLLVKFIKPNRIDLFEYIGIRHDLEDLTGRQVDLVEQGQEVEKIKPIIDREKKLIYERKAI